MCIPGKAVVSMPIGGPAMMNNYMIAQPPGFQLAAFVSMAVLTCFNILLDLTVYALQLIDTDSICSLSVL